MKEEEEDMEEEDDDMEADKEGWGSRENRI